MTDKIPRISGSELRERLQHDSELLLIDVLPGDRYRQIRLPGASNACVFEVTFLQQVAALAPDKAAGIVVYGADREAHDAVTAADKLRREGYTRVVWLEGGLSGWQRSGYPLEGDDPAAAEAPESRPADGRHRIDTAASIIAWTGRNPNSTHHGTLRLAGGEVEAAEGRISGSFEIDMHSIANLNLAGDELQPVLEAHLKSDDFFFVNRFPRARYTMTAVPTASGGPASAPNYRVSGQLELRGISAGLNFPAHISLGGDGRLLAEAHFDFDRTRWGVIYGSTRFFRHLGMHLVFDQISLQLRIATEPGPA